MYNKEGKEMGPIMVGGISYAPQKHLVAAKIHARNMGPIDKLTK